MHHVSLLIFTCLMLFVAAGCQTSLKNVAKASTGQLEPPAVAERRRPSPVTQASNQMVAAAGPLEEPTREEAFQSILGDLQQIGAENPAAQQQLLAQLAQADPAHWDALVQRMKSTMQYHQQLVGESQKTEVMHASTQDATSPPTHYPTTAPAAGAAPRPQQPATWPPAPQSQDVSLSPDHGAQARLVDAAVAQASATSPAYPVTNTSAADPLTPYPMTPQPAHLQTGGLQSEPPLTWDASLGRSIELLESQLRSQPQSTAEAYQHVRLRLLQLAAGNLDDAAVSPPGLTAAEQQYWSNQLLTISTLLDQRSQPEVRRRAAAGGLHLQNAVTALAQLGSLTVGHLVFCEEVYGFGAYQAVESARFKPGEEVKVYAEVANFKTVTTPQGEHTALATSYRVLDQHGGRVDGGDVPIVEDYCASRRRDFHIQYGITLPKGIYPGNYVLELTLTDQLGDKIGQGSIGFEIVAPQ